MLTLSFPKAGISWLAWFALVPLLVALRNLSHKNGFVLGLCAGLVHYVTLVYWLAYTMKTYGHLPFYVSVPILLLFSTYLALYPAVFSMALIWLCPRPVFLVFMPPIIWVALEYIRSFLFTGFPWELLGYTQFNVLNIIQISDLLGVYGVSFCILFANGSTFLVYLFLTQKDWQRTSVQAKLAAGALATFAVIFGLVWFYGSYRIRAIQERIVNSPSPKITVVQGNIDQAQKWDPAYQLSSTLKYIDLSRKAVGHGADLVVWPETATPFYFMHNIRLSELVLEGIQEAGVDVLFGSPSLDFKENRVEYYNSAYLVTPEGDVRGKYDKAHLVPFGEYIPFKKWLPFLGKMVENVGDFRPGKKGHTLHWENYRIGIQICYEIIFPNLSRHMAQNDAALLINITNDAWYGRTSAPYQHFSMAVLRAAENKRSIIRAANTGISGFIDPIGRIIATTPLFEDVVMTRTVPVLRETTVYTRFGDVFASACLIISMITATVTCFFRPFRKYSA